MKKRIPYLLLVLVIITAGLLSRKISAIPLWIGDALYAAMVYFILRCIWVQKSARFSLLCSVFICCCIELSQLYQGAWINNLRNTLPGRLVLGRGFLWTDLIAYATGALAAFFLETGFLKVAYRK